MLIPVLLCSGDKQEKDNISICERPLCWLLKSWNHSQIMKQFDLWVLMPNKCHSLVQGLLLSVRKTLLFYRKCVILRSHDRNLEHWVNWPEGEARGCLELGIQHNDVDHPTWPTLSRFQLLSGNTEFYTYVTSMICHQVKFPDFWPDHISLQHSSADKQVYQ